MDFTNISLNQPIRPEIECDGWYAYCVWCKTEIEPHDNICPECNQLQDWSWFGEIKVERSKNNE